jgi:hypothetical protein
VGLYCRACERDVKRSRVLLPSEAVAHEKLFAPQVYIQIVGAEERFEESNDLVLDRLGKSILRRLQVNPIWKPAVDVVSPIDSVLLKAGQDGLFLPPGVKPAREARRDRFGQSLDLGFEIVVCHNQRPDGRPRIATTSRDGGIRGSIECMGNHGGISLGMLIGGSMSW